MIRQVLLTLPGYWVLKIIGRVLSVGYGYLGVVSTFKDIISAHGNVLLVSLEGLHKKEHMSFFGLNDADTGVVGGA